MNEALHLIDRYGSYAAESLRISAQVRPRCITISTLAHRNAAQFNECAGELASRFGLALLTIDHPQLKEAA